MVEVSDGPGSYRGDALSIFLYTSVFASLLLVADIVLWILVYRRVFEQVNR